MSREAELVKFCQDRLSALGFEHFMGENPEGQEVIRVPAFETQELWLSRKAVYAFIHEKLWGDATKSFMAVIPGETVGDVYCYYPVTVITGRKLEADDLLVWGARADLIDFDWTEAVEGDDSAWSDGWDSPYDDVPARIFNLAAMLNYQIIVTPVWAALTRQELIDHLNTSKVKGFIFAHSKDHNDRWSLKLSADGTGLDLHKQSDGTVTPITDEHFDQHGQLVLEGHTILNRCWGF
jgi:hypothetical protein